MAIEKTGACPGGGDHEWVKVNPGTYKCKKCPAVKKTGEGSAGTKKTGKTN